VSNISTLSLPQKFDAKLHLVVRFCGSHQCRSRDWEKCLGDDAIPLMIIKSRRCECNSSEHKTYCGGTCTHIERDLMIISGIASSPKHFSQVTRATLMTPAKRTTKCNLASNFWGKERVEIFTHIRTDYAIVFPPIAMQAPDTLLHPRLTSPKRSQHRGLSQDIPRRVPGRIGPKGGDDLSKWIMAVMKTL